MSLKRRIKRPPSLMVYTYNAARGAFYPTNFILGRLTNSFTKIRADCCEIGIANFDMHTPGKSLICTDVFRFRRIRREIGSSKALKRIKNRPLKWGKLRLMLILVLVLSSLSKISSEKKILFHHELCKMIKTYMQNLFSCKQKKTDGTLCKSCNTSF